MNKILIVALSVIISACGSEVIWETKCDSGFSTGDADYSTINDGVIIWQDLNGTWKSRRMIGGEVCETKKINTNP